VKRAELTALLRTYESRNVTYLGEDFPLFWDSASGATITDVDGNEFIDCTAAFGVANVGHCNPHVVSAVAAQAQRLMQGMGDVHPPAIRAELLERLAGIVPHGLQKVFLATTGSEAIEAALKTAMLVTGRTRFASYRGAYHGLSFGALAVGGIERFRAPFDAALPRETITLEYPRLGQIAADDAAREVHQRLRDAGDVAALVIEPIQGRGGCIVPPDGYLSYLRTVCDDLGIVLIVDEIYTGFGRTGAWFAIERERIVPDILCIGKAMGGGVPISAAVGKDTIMDAWPASTGEALHTSTFLGNPLACAAAIATIEELHHLKLPLRAAQLGALMESRLHALQQMPGVVDVRGRGMMWGVELRDAVTAARVVQRALAQGVIFLQSGIDGATISLTPPLVIEEAALMRAIATLADAIAENGR
jgi:4-aminobutyrate aminotransferase/(S)-3-amino-2-methylpropionate transaminase